jgi:hypothetical protein
MPSMNTKTMTALNTWPTYCLLPGEESESVIVEQQQRAAQIFIGQRRAQDAEPGRSRRGGSVGIAAARQWRRKDSCPIVYDRGTQANCVV